MTSRPDLLPFHPRYASSPRISALAAKLDPMIARIIITLAEERAIEDHEREQAARHDDTPRGDLRPVLQRSSD